MPRRSSQRESEAAVRGTRPVLAWLKGPLKGEPVGNQELPGGFWPNARINDDETGEANLAELSFNQYSIVMSPTALNSD